MNDFFAGIFTALMVFTAVFAWFVYIHLGEQTSTLTTEDVNEARQFSRDCKGVLAVKDYGGIGRWKLECVWRGEENEE